MKSQPQHNLTSSKVAGVRKVIIIVLLGLLAGCGASTSSDSGGSSTIPRTGKAGSQSRFALVDNYLYAVTGTELQIFDVTTASNPNAWTRQFIGFNIETLFRYKQYLFVGSQDGIYIYDNTNVQSPVKISQLSHARSCDPVVVDGNYAYVTLRSNNSACGGNSNELDIVDISTITEPKRVSSYPMQSPAGLGVENGKLFLCDGIAGLKVFNVTDPMYIGQPIDWIAGQNCYDVIPGNGLLVVTGVSGLTQYDYTSLPMTQLSNL